MKKYLAIVEFIDNEIITIVHDSVEEMEDYLQEMADYLNRIILTMEFGAEKGDNDVKILSQN